MFSSFFFFFSLKAICLHLIAITVLSKKKNGIRKQEKANYELVGLISI